MRLSNRSRSIITEARRRIEENTHTVKVEVFVFQPGDNSEPPVASDGITQFVIRLSDEDHPPVFSNNGYTVQLADL